jgi:hypothetical protein
MLRSCLQFLPGLAPGGWGTPFRLYEIAGDRETAEIRSRILAGIKARLGTYTYLALPYDAGGSAGEW